MGYNSIIAKNSLLGGEIMKKYAFFMVVLLLPVFYLTAGGGSDQSDKPFSWSMGLQDSKTKNLVPFSAPVESSTGSSYLLYIKPDSDCFAYLIYEGSDGDVVAVLFDGTIKNGENWQSVPLTMAPPEGDNFFYMIVSRGEQKALAERISAFKANSGNAQRRALMNEVFQIRSEVSQFKETPEKPVLMGGAARGDPEKSQGVQYSGLAAYVKTVSIKN